MSNLLNSVDTASMLSAGRNICKRWAEISPNWFGSYSYTIKAGEEKVSIITRPDGRAFKYDFNIPCDCYLCTLKDKQK